MSDEMDSGVATMIDTASAGVDSTPAVDSAVTTETPSTETTTDSTVDSPSTGAETTEDEADLIDEKGNARTEEEVKAFRAEKANAVAGKAPLPQEVRRALKSLKDSDPKNEAIVKQLHGHFERFEALKNLGAGNVSEVKALLADAGVKNFSELRAAYATQSQSADAVRETDQLLYTGDKRLWQNVADDLRATSHEDALGKLAPSFLDTLKELDSESYHSLVTERSIEHMRASGLPEALNRLNTAVQGNAAAQGILKSIADWFNQNEESSSERAKEARGLDRLAQEKSKWEQEKSASETSTWENSVAESADKDNNLSLGRALAPYLKMPFFKEHGRASLIDLGNAIKARLYSDLKASKEYQAQMSALWKGGVSEANKAKILKFHQDYLKDHSEEVVRKVVQLRFPGYARGGSAAGKIAARNEKKASDTAAGISSVTNNRPIYVAQRPASLIHEDITVNGKTYDSNALQMLQIAGKGFVRGTTKGTYRLVTWRRPS